jgi:endonuclease YncB( thermonuclease family)
VLRPAVLCLALVLGGCAEAESSSGPQTVTETVTETRETTVTGEIAPPAPARPTRTVASVTDGDTLRLDDGTRVRLVQIDAPELGSGECYSRKSAGVLARLAPVGSGVRLRADPALDRTDRYGRALRYVFRGGTNVNVALVRRGAAAPWFFDGDRGRYADRLLAAAEEAKAAGRGLWGACPGTRLDPTRGVETLAAAPPPPPAPAAAAGAGAAAGSRCHPSYAGACLDPSAPDYDCAGGSGNGPLYTGPVRVVGPDDFGLDSDGDGLGCEDA